MLQSINQYLYCKLTTVIIPIMLQKTGLLNVTQGSYKVHVGSTAGSHFSKLVATPAMIRPLFFYFLVYGFLGGKNGSVGRKKIKNNFFSKGSIMSSCRKKLPVHGNSNKKFCSEHYKSSQTKLLQYI